MAVDIPVPNMSRWGDFSDILQNMIQNRQKQQEMADMAQYRQGTLQQQAQELAQKKAYEQGLLGLKQAEEKREASKFPLTLDELRAKIESEKALAKQRNELGLFGGGRGGGVDLKNVLALTRQAMIDNPGIDFNKANQIASAWLQGSEELPSGEKTPEMSGLANQMLMNVTKAPVAIKNQAAQSDILLNDLKNYDIEAVKNFTGVQGKAKLLAAQAKMAINPDDPSIDPMARRYIASIRDTISNMDQMRKAYGTSVVPDYVYNTIGRLANPNDSIWNDPKQVEMNFNKVIKTIENNKNQLFEKVKRGVTATYKEKESKSKDNDPLGIR